MSKCYDGIVLFMTLCAMTVRFRTRTPDTVPKPQDSAHDHHTDPPNC